MGLSEIGWSSAKIRSDEEPAESVARCASRFCSASMR
jgi:hypothetical protein